MAPRKPTTAPQNTQGENGPAKAADTPITAVDPEGTSGEAIAPAGDGEVTQVPPLSSAAGGAGGGGGPDPDEKRVATVASAISHDGEDYGVDDVVLLTFDAFEKLRPTGALVEVNWDDCSPFE